MPRRRWADIPDVVLKQFADGRVLEFDQGLFDRYCVYISGKGGTKRIAPKDVQYFTRLAQLAKRHGTQCVYSLFSQICARTTNRYDPEVMRGISVMASDFGADALDVDVVMSILYASMIAEECKDGTVLGKRVKHLGVYQVLIGGMAPSQAASFSRGMKASEIAALCRDRGF